MSWRGDWGNRLDWEEGGSRDVSGLETGETLTPTVGRKYYMSRSQRGVFLLISSVHHQVESRDFREAAGGAGEEGQEAAGGPAGARRLRSVPQPAGDGRARTHPPALRPGKHTHVLGD